MLYFLHALTLLYVDGGERWLALVELLLTFAAFIGNTLYARLRGKELGLKLTKLSEVEKQEKPILTTNDLLPIGDPLLG